MVLLAQTPQTSLALIIILLVAPPVLQRASLAMGAWVLKLATLPRSQAGALTTELHPTTVITLVHRAVLLLFLQAMVPPELLAEVLLAQFPLSHLRLNCPTLALQVVLLLLPPLFLLYTHARLPLS